MSPGVLVTLGCVLVVGALVQGLVGLGVGLVSAPIVTLLAPDLMPGMLLFIGFLTPTLTLLLDHDEIDWSGLVWSLPMRIPGTVAGVGLVLVATERSLGLLVGTMVLLSVVVTWRSVNVPVNRGTLATAGFLSGLTATTTSIGGPPIAVLYQHQPARRIRSTLAVYFGVGALFSLIGLALVGEITRAQVVLAACSIPALMVGVWLAGVVRRRAPRDSIRIGVLAVCAASALALLVRSLFG